MSNATSLSNLDRFLLAGSAIGIGSSIDAQTRELRALRSQISYFASQSIALQQQQLLTQSYQEACSRVIPELLFRYLENKDLLVEVADQAINVFDNAHQYDALGFVAPSLFLVRQIYRNILELDSSYLKEFEAKRL